MEHNPLLRPGMAAIAAALAFTATPAFAQDASAAAEQPPVIVASPTADPVEIVPLDAASAPVLSQAAPELAPAPMPVPTMQPIIHQPTAADLRTTRTASAPAAPRAISVPVERAASTVIAAPAPARPAPVEVANIPTPVVAPAPVQRTVTTTTGVNNDALPYIGAGAAVLLLIGGTAAVTRLRRREETALEERYESDRAIEFEPATAAPMLARSSSASSAAAILPSGFDLSRFGRHTQAAYRGPTPENPSMSLRKRLKRASFFDGRERIVAEMEAAPMQVPATAAARTAKAPAMADEQIVVRPQAVKQRPSLRPSFAR